MRTRLLLAALAVVSCSSWWSPAVGQTPPMVQQNLTFPWDSGSLDNPSASEKVLASTTIRVAHASWIRLRFQLATLWHDDDQSGAFLRITSHADGAVQELRARHVREWKLTSAYFNGDAVQLDLVAPAGAGPSRVLLRSIWIGPQLNPQFTICGPTDDRVLSNDPRSARLMPIGCTGWIFDDAAHGFGTAGHCAGTLSVLYPEWLDVAEFNVPLSLPGGLLQHPPPDDQYAIDDTSIQYENAGLGDDWAYLGCFPNPNTGLTPFQAQGASYQLIPAPPFDANDVVRVTGYGIDTIPDPTMTQVQQTDSGAMYSFSGTTLRYTVDTTGGNSGSPIIFESGGPDQVIGVHTHGGCSSSIPSFGNHGTASQQANWVAARADPRGVCDPTPSFANYCTAKVNSLGCTPSIGAVGSPTTLGGAGSFTIQATELLNEKVGFFFYGLLPAATPFQGGTKCVKAPTRRSKLMSTQGSSGVPDCSGLLSFDMGARIASGVDPNLTAGAIIYVQAWSRDAADPYTINLTGGLRFTIGQ